MSRPPLPISGTKLVEKSNRALKRAVIVQLIKMLMCYGSYPMNYNAFRYTGIALSFYI